MNEELIDLLQEFQNTNDLRKLREIKEELHIKVDELYGEKKEQTGGCENCGYWAFTDRGNGKKTCNRCGNVEHDKEEVEA